MIKFIKKYPKSIAFTIGLVVTLFFGVTSWGWSDNADSKFWWTLWPIIGGVCLALFVGAILWATNSKHKFDEE